MGYPHIVAPPEPKVRLEFTLAFPSVVQAIRMAGHLHELGLPASVLDGNPSFVTGSCVGTQIARVNFALHLVEEWSRA